LIIGDVVHFAIDRALFLDGVLDLTRSRPVGRLARGGYVLSTTFVDLPRPTYRGLLAEGRTPKRDASTGSSS
jgi:hypothetical protein